MSIEAEGPAEFPFRGERATENELEVLEVAAYSLAEYGQAVIHRQFECVNRDTGDVIYFKLRSDGDDEGTANAYAAIGVILGDTGGELLSLTFDPTGKLCDANDSDLDAIGVAVHVMEEFLAEERLDNAAAMRVISQLSTALKGEYPPEVAAALLLAQKNSCTSYIPSISEQIGDLVRNNTELATKIGIFQEATDDWEISVFTNDFIGDGLTDDLYEQVPYGPLQIIYEDHRTALNYIYRCFFDGRKTLEIYSPLHSEEEAMDNPDIPEPGLDDIRIITEKLQEAIIRVKNRSKSVDQELLADVHVAGSNMLLNELQQAGSVSDYIFQLVLAYHETQMFQNMKEVAHAFGMFEMQDDPVYTEKAKDALLKGLLLGFHVAVETLPDDAKALMDFVDISSISLGEPEPQEAEAYDVTDDTASMAELYYGAANYFHAFFDLWEDQLCQDIHFQRYMKRGFGLMLSVIDQASKLYAMSVESEGQGLMQLPEGESNLEEAFAEIEQFLQEQLPES